jgi:hypothetical protein
VMAPAATLNTTFGRTWPNLAEPAFEPHPNGLAPAPRARCCKMTLRSNAQPSAGTQEVFAALPRQMPMCITPEKSVRGITPSVELRLHFLR